MWALPACTQEFINTSLSKAHITAGDAVLRVLTWPAEGPVPFRTLAADDHTKLRRTEAYVLAGERLGFFADAATTELGLRSRCHEVDPLNTLFGSTNQTGVLGSMTAWELGFSYASAVVPRWLEHTRLRGASHVAVIIGGSVFAGFRVRTSIRNYRVAQGSHN